MSIRFLPPLRFSIPAVLGALGLILVLLAFFDGIQRSESLIEGEARAQLLTFGTRIAARLESMYAGRDSRGVSDILIRTASEPHLLTAVILDSQGNTVESSEVELLGKKIVEFATPWAETALRDALHAESAQHAIDRKGDGLEGIFPIALPPLRGELRSTRYAALYLYSDLSETKRLNWARHVERAWIMGAVVAIVLALVWFYFNLAVTKRLEQLSQAMQRAASDHRAEYAAVDSGNDEVGRLSAGFAAMLADIQRHSSALAASEDRHRSVVEAMSEGVLMFDAKGQVVATNDNAARILGVPREEVGSINMFDHGWQVFHEDGRPMTAEEYPASATFRTGETVSNVIIGVLRPDKQFIWLSANSAPVWLDAARTARGVVTTLNDITERREFEARAAEQRGQLEAQLRQSQKMQSLGTLTGGIAHDFNNILTAISGNVRLAIADLPKTDPVQRSLAEIDKAAARATDLVRQVLAFGRRQEAQRVVVDMAAVITDGLNFLRAMIPATIEIRSRFAEALPQVAIDRTQLHQVITNLGSNAAHAIGDRPGIVDVRLDEVQVSTDQQRSLDVQAGRYVRLSFVDNGAGIDSVLLDRIFEPFFTTKGLGQGTGLGLSVVHGIMRNHEGAITVQSTRGVGTRFDLYFPAYLDPVVPASLDAGRPPLAANAGKGKVIVYVDDEDALVFLVTRLLERQGYTVLGFTQPEHAMTEFAKNPQRIDALISDLAMPGMTGFDIAREALAIRSDLPIILVSGYIRPQDVEFARGLGIRRLILKPDTVDALAAALHELLVDAEKRSTSATN